MWNVLAQALISALVWLVYVDNEVVVVAATLASAVDA